MDLSGLKLKPAEGMLLLKFVDDEDESEPLPEGDYEGCLAIVVAAGSKTTSKVGSTVVTDAWARDGRKIGGGVLVSQYSILATITG
jgi:hypothetical protein